MNYNALTETDLLQHLGWEGYTLRYNDNDLLELFRFTGGYQTTRPYREESTGEVFESISLAHRYVFTL